MPKILLSEKEWLQSVQNHHFLEKKHMFSYDFFLFLFYWSRVDLGNAFIFSLSDKDQMETIDEKRHIWTHSKGRLQSVQPDPTTLYFHRSGYIPHMIPGPGGLCVFDFS